MGIRGILRFLAHRTLEISVILVLILVMPKLPPYADFSKSYKVVPPKLEGKWALNERLNGAEILYKGSLTGPEAFADDKGVLYASLQSGDVVKFSGNHVIPVVKFGKPCKGFHEEEICGRPLGMTFDKKGYLYVADAFYGIFKVNVKTGDSERIISPDVEIDGEKPKIFNSLAVATNGDIYWSDSSSKFQLNDGVFEVLSDGSGRLLHYNAKTRQNTVLMKDMIFANGVSLSEDEDFIILAETSRNRIHRYYLKGPKAGTHNIFIDGLPGMPDNIKPDGHGGFLVPLVAAVDAENPSLMQVFAPFPRVRKLVARLMGIVDAVLSYVNHVQPSDFVKRGAHFVGHFSSVHGLFSPIRVTVVHISKNGEVLDVIHSLDGKIRGISEAHVFKDDLYLGSPFNDYVAKIPLSKIGWTHLKVHKVASKSATPEPSAATKQTTTTTPKPSTTTTTPKPTTTTTKPATTTTPKPTTTQKPATVTTPKPTTTTTQKPTTTTTPKPATTTTPKPATTTTQKPTTTTVKPTTAPPKVTTPKPTAKPAPSTPKETTAPPKPTTPPPKPTTTPPKPTTTPPKPAAVKVEQPKASTQTSQQKQTEKTKESHPSQDQSKPAEEKKSQPTKN